MEHSICLIVHTLVKNHLRPKKVSEKTHEEAQVNFREFTVAVREIIGIM